ncbi:TetR family transcriptional regulator [Novosphingobium sediminis]|uniref:TetR family transcriptional regulator n=1 Tax=Novosphingobium sediminis TaxID=707214 RepID=A0A512AG24_9SPHN|nr:TetR/AcrR family transcriptional regulator [Novosphingobium sediminis]GEN98649.1 TetR family transcriptional regulator [Novosphingobium sediminis]
MASLPIQSPPSLSPRAARTRSALISAGFELLAEKPIDAIPIDEVVARAGVAKGSFFNHFSDKPAFASAIAEEVRSDLEDRITAANSDVADPLVRIAGGMCVGAAFALAEPKRTIVLLRSNASSTLTSHPLNRGLVVDIEAALAAGLLRDAARTGGVLYWLGLCQVLLANLVEERSGLDTARERLSAMLVLGLTGLGAEPERAQQIADTACLTL